MSVPLFATSLAAHQQEIAERLAAVARDGRYILGPEVAAFEAEFAAYLGVPHCVGVANGTEAITIALRAMGIEPGDEVVVPSFTFYATAEAVVNAGARPVFADVDPGTFCVTRATVERAMSARTRAVVAVHLFGEVAPVEEIAGLGVPVLEDAAQAAGASRHGHRAGSLGVAATFSFFPSKNLGGLGDGGAVVTRSHEVAARARRLRFHGSEDKVTHTEVGYNSRLDSLQATVLRLLLGHLDEANAARRAAAAAYERQGLGAHVALPHATPGTMHAHHLYVARHPRADELIAALGGAGIGAKAYYRRPVHRQPAMARFVPDGLALPGTDEAARDHLALPMGPELTEGNVAEVVAAVAAAGL